MGCIACHGVSSFTFSFPIFIFGDAAMCRQAEGHSGSTGKPLRNLQSVGKGFRLQSLEQQQKGFSPSKRAVERKETWVKNKE